MSIAFDLACPPRSARSEHHGSTRAAGPADRRLSRLHDVDYVDNERCALWVPRKFDPPASTIAKLMPADGSMRADLEQQIRLSMPPSYRQVYENLSRADRIPYLDLIRSIYDNDLEAAVREIPAVSTQARRQI